MPSLTDIEVRLLVDAIYLRWGHDFRDYSLASLHRRVQHAREQMGLPTISALQDRVLHDADAFAQVLQYLTVPVSEMFRDPPYFLALRGQVAPVLRTYPSIKVWVAGCSTGEEAYSLAILLREEGLLDRAMVYATDINQSSLERARKGIYPLESMQLFTQNYQRAGGTQSFSRYYTAGYGGAVFDRQLRESITFADHSLATDSVFAETHLVSCRNVLIYFNRKLQDRAIGLFHESLAHRGFLGLGSKETLDFSAWAGHFEPVARRERLFRKLPGAAP
ncbi:CheR family methyltransferase [Ramlibacter rhizophilus]|uniref:Protein-glutamate O-methyltransferase CheR n=1 Tax=Ramlibacter rhizophilus TaxID=1781167 RepID=A0A4Z0BNQ5_9BURK|nr:protein-glutamate O-methyltransferase CheR [Ramlibacter rhizophilus]TFY99568.1 protein-glutamate O-methyltransferase CheR [Ramlibacter rhizophilus]